MDIPSSPQLNGFPPDRGMPQYGTPGGLQRQMSGGPSPNYPSDMYSMNSHPPQHNNIMYNNQLARGQLHSPMDSMDSSQMSSQFSNGNHHSIDQ